MAFKIRITERAERDALQAADFIARDGIDRATKWYFELRERIDSLRQYPERCPLAPESTRFDVEIREALHGPFRILFTISGKTVTILHIRYGARDEWETK